MKKKYTIPSIYMIHTEQVLSGCGLLPGSGSQPISNEAKGIYNFEDDEIQDENSVFDQDWIESSHSAQMECSNGQL